ncbi:multiple sugar transport system permease protein [Halanaerobium saccharolyticum]|uniref:Multiple sugar transport system permease protein n=1 Tax=Halanaerobium saccharolyticum TaxID=43595 RepID=A0A4R7YUH9_9FIRM|nr:carbohydrate ABC transporter permease [Halanaerobium saccharolyticum]RAK06868.1 multiple sugar transport system permease protein [Halanaerobium saccharolyticum]TDW01478.1 multiple sugar transport system permease protein [Halanaerobium saccharolyticum]TDX52839.1 multiple sugar transport system permease protein [Halanaerobium saccharolyticum]
MNLTFSQKEKIKNILFHVLVGGFCFFMLYPLLWMVAGSLKTSGNALSATLWPQAMQFSNFLEGWRGFGGVSFAVFFRNSFFIAGTATVGQIILASFSAFGFTRTRFIGQKFWFAIMIATVLVPGQILRIPQYIMFNQWGWVGSFLPVILPQMLPVPFFTFLMVQFVRGIPKELDEAAEIDGCSKFGIFFKIILPNLKPVLVTAGIFRFYWSWNDFMTPLLYLQSVTKYPVSIALKMFSDPNAITNWGAMFAMTFLSILPTIILFIFFQRYLIDGVAFSGID